MTPADEHVLYVERPDLWAVTRVLIHCKTESTQKVRKKVWKLLTPEDQSFLKTFEGENS